MKAERHPLLLKYLRLRREWRGADPRSGRHRRLAQEVAQLERAFVDTGVTPFADTQPCEQVDHESEKSAASDDLRSLRIKRSC
jgi:hypothetical protein